MATVWNTPKYDFLITDGLTNSHMNDIGENQEILHRGNSGITSVTMASDLGINMQSHTFYVTGGAGTTLNRIRYTDGTDSRIDGNVIFIIFAQNITIAPGSATSGQYYGLDGTQIITTVGANDAVGFVLYNTKWSILKGKT